MHRLTKVSAIFAIGLVAACQNSGVNYVPVIDGPVGPNFSADLAQCQNLAASAQGTVDSNTAGSAAIGAGVGAATSAILNDSSRDIGRAAAVGALAGVTGSAVQNTQQQETIIRNCMRGRGYNVVG